MVAEDKVGFYHDYNDDDHELVTFRAGLGENIKVTAFSGRIKLLHLGLGLNNINMFITAFYDLIASRCARLKRLREKGEVWF